MKFKSEARYESRRWPDSTVTKYYSADTMEDATRYAMQGVRADYPEFWTIEVERIAWAHILTDGCSIIGYVNVWEEWEG